MERIELKAKLREEAGKGPSRRLRRQGRVPAVVYGGTGEPVAIDINAREFESVLRHAGGNVLFGLVVEGARSQTPQTVMLREVQHGFMTGEVVHADFRRISLDEKIRIQVPVEAVGECEGVKMGGILERALWHIQVECLPTKIPDSIRVDVSGLGIGDSLHVRDLVPPEGAVILDEPDRTVVTIVAPKAVAEEVAAPAEAAEPELVREEKKEAEAEEKAEEEKREEKE